MRTVLRLTLRLTCSSAGVGQTSAPPRFEELVRQFVYDAKAPLDAKEVGREKRGGRPSSDFARFAEPKRIALYDAGHELNAAARRERAGWLAQRLSLRRVDFDALARIPQLR